MKHQPGNVLGGTPTFYLVATAWMTARRSTARTGLAFVLCVVHRRILPLLLMIFWLLRVRMAKAYESLITRGPVLQKGLHTRAYPARGEGPAQNALDAEQVGRPQGFGIE